MITTADDCRRRLQYAYIRHVSSDALPANLALGTCVDVATKGYLRALILGQPLPDPVAEFRRCWNDVVRTKTLVFAASQSLEKFARTGSDLMQAFPGAWDQSGYEVAFNAKGDLMLDVKLSHYLGRQGEIDLYLDGELDLLVYTDESDLAVLDVKSAASAHTPLYAMRSDQLTCYQILVESNGPMLGLPPLAKLGFLDFVKRTASSRIEKPLLVPPRSAPELLEFRQKCFWLAEDIKRGRFPRTSRMQFNTPCEMCEFAQHCVHNDGDGLVFPTTPTTQTA